MSKERERFEWNEKDIVVEKKEENKVEEETNEEETNEK